MKLIDVFYQTYVMSLTAMLNARANNDDVSGLTQTEIKEYCASASKVAQQSVTIMCNVFPEQMK